MKTIEDVIKELFQGEPGVDDRKYGFKHIKKSIDGCLLVGLID